MIVDTSAIVAILRNEPDGGRYGAALAQAVEPLMSAGTYKGNDFTHTDIETAAGSLAKG